MLILTDITDNTKGAIYSQNITVRGLSAGTAGSEPP